MHYTVVELLVNAFVWLLAKQNSPMNLLGEQSARGGEIITTGVADFEDVDVEERRRGEDEMCMDDGSRRRGRWRLQ